ncbi:MAG: hypothetical protein QM764_20780 [Chitinophagaceae bacterium]
MSISGLISSINAIDQEIHNLEQQISSVNQRISGKQREATAILEKISREKNLTRIVQLQPDLGRKQDEVTQVEKERSTKEKAVADKKKRKGELQVQVSKEEQREREVSRKEQQQLLSIQQEITREMERQQYLSRQSLFNMRPVSVQKQFDVFVSHASEDKEDLSVHLSPRSVQKVYLSGMTKKN